MELTERSWLKTILIASGALALVTGAIIFSLSAWNKKQNAVFANCGGYGPNPLSCQAGYVCTAPKDQPNATNRCTPPELNETYTVPLYYHNDIHRFPVEVRYPDNFVVQLKGFTDACGPAAGAPIPVSCADPGEITIFVTLKKGNETLDVTVAGTRHSNERHTSFGYSIDFLDLNRSQVGIRVTKN